MKKLFILLAGVFLMLNSASGQGVDDRAVIPVSVTLNSILRLNVVSGGNIEFNFNTLADYTNGIPNSPAYDTQFTVASSVNWEVTIYSEETDLIGTDDATGSNTLELNNIGYQIAYNGPPASAGNFNLPASGTTRALTAAEAVLVGLGGLSNAGDVNTNDFTINWRCGTREGGGMNGASLLEQSAAADRYATNVFLILKPL